MITVNRFSTSNRHDHSLLGVGQNQQFLHNFTINKMGWNKDVITESNGAKPSKVKDDINTTNANRDKQLAYIALAT
jgi:IS4 transposase